MRSTAEKNGHARVERVDFLDGDFVELLDRIFDATLRGALVHEKHEGVVVLDFFHRRLGGHRVLDDGVLVEPIAKKFIIYENVYWYNTSNILQFS